MVLTPLLGKNPSEGLKKKRRLSGEVNGDLCKDVTAMEKKVDVCDDAMAAGLEIFCCQHKRVVFCIRVTAKRPSKFCVFYICSHQIFLQTFKLDEVCHALFSIPCSQEMADGVSKSTQAGSRSWDSADWYNCTAADYVYVLAPLCGFCNDTGEGKPSHHLFATRCCRSSKDDLVVGQATRNLINIISRRDDSENEDDTGIDRSEI